MGAWSARNFCQHTNLKYFLLKYEYVPDILERRGEYRPAHLSHVLKAEKLGNLSLAGAMNPASSGALFIWRTPGTSTIEQFAQKYSV